MSNSKKRNPRKMLVASVGIATLNYTLVTGCDGQLILDPIIPGAGAGGMQNQAGMTATGVGTGGSAGFGVAGTPAGGAAGTAGSGVGGFGGSFGISGSPSTAGTAGSTVGGADNGGDTSDAGPSDASAPDGDASVDGG